MSSIVKRGPLPQSSLAGPEALADPPGISTKATSNEPKALVRDFSRGTRKAARSDTRRAEIPNDPFGKPLVPKNSATHTVDDNVPPVMLSVLDQVTDAVSLSVANLHHKYSNMMHNESIEDLYLRELNSSITNICSSSEAPLAPFAQDFSPTLKWRDLEDRREEFIRRESFSCRAVVTGFNDVEFDMFKNAYDAEKQMSESLKCFREYVPWQDLSRIIHSSAISQIGQYNIWLVAKHIRNKNVGDIHVIIVFKSAKHTGMISRLLLGNTDKVKIIHRIITVSNTSL